MTPGERSIFVQSLLVEMGTTLGDYIVAFALP